VDWKSAQQKQNIFINMIDNRSPISMKVVKFSSPQPTVPHPFADCQKGIVRITRDGLQSLLNFMAVGSLLQEKFDNKSLLDFVHIDVIDIRNAEKSPMFAKTSRLSSITSD
jgi:hypothetical protein